MQKPVLNTPPPQCPNFSHAAVPLVCVSHETSLLKPEAKTAIKINLQQAFLSKMKRTLVKIVKCNPNRFEWKLFALLRKSKRNSASKRKSCKLEQFLLSQFSYFRSNMLVLISFTVLSLLF